MSATKTRSRLDLWATRRAHQDRLTLLRAARSAVCGCIRCADHRRGVELDALIATTRARITDLQDRICERS